MHWLIRLFRRRGSEKRRRQVAGRLLDLFLSDERLRPPGLLEKLGLTEEDVRPRTPEPPKGPLTGDEFDRLLRLCLREDDLRPPELDQMLGLSEEDVRPRTSSPPPLPDDIIGEEDMSSDA